MTSTSTPGSMLMEVICFTISEGLCKSMSRLWMRIWKRSQVFEPSPQGVFLVVMRRVCSETTNTGYQAEAQRSPFPFSTFMALLHSCPQCQSTLSSHYLFTLYRPQFSSTAFHHNFFSKKLFSVLICRKKKVIFPILEVSSPWWACEQVLSPWGFSP